MWIQHWSPSRTHGLLIYSGSTETLTESLGGWNSLGCCGCRYCGGLRLVVGTSWWMCSGRWVVGVLIETCIVVSLPSQQQPFLYPSTPFSSLCAWILTGCHTRVSSSCPKLLPWAWKMLRAHHARGILLPHSWVVWSTGFSCCSLWATWLYKFTREYEHVGIPKRLCRRLSIRTLSLEYSVYITLLLVVWKFPLDPPTHSLMPSHCAIHFPNFCSRLHALSI